MEDDELIARAQLGDTDAFHRLVESYSDVAWRTARVLLQDRGQAEDAIQEAWLDVWQGLHRFTLGRPIRPWLLTLVANRCRMSGRRRVVMTVPLTVDEAELLVGADDVGGDLLRREADADLRAALALLPPDQQRVLELRYFADLDLGEIAAVTGIALGTVKSRLHRALGALRISLSPPYRDRTLIPDGER